jgi:hypothetical protein
MLPILGLFSCTFKKLDLPEKTFHTYKQQISNDELVFLKKLKSENNSILVSDSVTRYFTIKYSENLDSFLTFSQLIISQDTLLNLGYIYSNLTILGDLTEPNIIYSYNKGQSDYGYGVVNGLSTSEYMHSISSFGMTGKIVSVYYNGKQMISKRTELKE